MALTAGIIGLPNVGKSTLFNAITKSQVEAANYPFATIDPNIGVVEVPDHRLDELVKLMAPERTIPTTFIFTDIAGLVKGASKGEGLGNKFLENIKNTDAICHVVRCFDDKDITHVEATIDPIRDIEIIELELIFKDQAIVENVVSKIRKKAGNTKDPSMVKEVVTYDKVLKHLEDGKNLRSLELTEEQLEFIKPMNLLSSKPVLYVGNISESDVSDSSKNKYFIKIKKYAEEHNSQAIAISAKIESELAILSDEDRNMFMEDVGIKEAGLDQLIKASYSLLNLETYFTAGKKEVRAWTFRKGYTAPQCAGIIHTDFQKGFIRAEIMEYNDLIKLGSEQSVKEAGKWSSEGKEYLMKDGDIALFRFNV